MNSPSPHQRHWISLARPALLGFPATGSALWLVHRRVSRSPTWGLDDLAGGAVDHNPPGFEHRWSCPLPAAVGLLADDLHILLLYHDLPAGHMDVDPSGYSWKSFFKILAIVAIAVAVVATAGAALGAAPAVAAVIGEGVSLGAIGSTAGWVATGSFIASSLMPGQSSGLSPPATTAMMAASATIATGGLAPAALLGSAAIQAGIGYAGTRLLESPMAQEGIGRAAGALERFGMSPRAAVLLVSLAAGTVVFGALSSVAKAGVLNGIMRQGVVPAGDHIALGLSQQGLEQTAAQLGARHLMSDPNWRESLMVAIGNPNTKFTLILDGFEGTTTYGQLAGALQRGLTPAARNTEWEIAQLFQAGRLGKVTLMRQGQVIPNPFAD